jgi:hypothetical protein
MTTNTTSAVTTSLHRVLACMVSPLLKTSVLPVAFPCSVTPSGSLSRLVSPQAEQASCLWLGDRLGGGQAWGDHARGGHEARGGADRMRSGDLI